jgi:flagellar M-ring protein FliF
MGYSEARGDSLNVVNSQFNDIDPTPPFWRDPELIAMSKNILGWLLFAIVALWLYRKLRPVAMDYLYPQVDQELAATEMREAEREAREAERSRESNRYDENMQRAREMATKDPRAVAMVLRAWMGTDGNSA